MQGSAFVIFLFPAMISILFGTFVMAEVLKEPERQLNMWPFKSSETGMQSGAIKIIGLQKEYSTSAPIQIEISILDPTFDCGDLYLTIYDLGVSPNQVITQSGFFDQCFESNNLKLPVDDKFSETIDASGQYEIVVEMNDKHYKKIITASEKFIIK